MLIFVDSWVVMRAAFVRSVLLDNMKSPSTKGEEFLYTKNNMNIDKLLGFVVGMRNPKIGLDCRVLQLVGSAKWAFWLFVW